MPYKPIPTYTLRTVKSNKTKRDNFVRRELISNAIEDTRRKFITQLTSEIDNSKRVTTYPVHLIHNIDLHM